MLNKHITTDNLKTILPPIQHAIDKIDKKLGKPDWNENDPNASGYIKNRPFYTEENCLSIVSNLELTFSGYPLINSFEIDQIIEGQTYQVKWDGVDYECVAYISAGPNSPSIGSAAIGQAGDGGNNEPFFITIYNGSLMVFAQEVGTHIISIAIDGSIIHKIPEKYLPDAGVGIKGTGANSVVMNNNNAATASGAYSFVEGFHDYYRDGLGYETPQTGAYGDYSHAEGNHTIASGKSSHSEGSGTDAIGDYSHAEGVNTYANGKGSHAEGYNTTANSEYSHAEGESAVASGKCSHVEGYYTRAGSENQHVQGKYNIEDTVNQYAHIVGNGTSTSKRSNAHTLDWNGNAWFAGNICIGGVGQDDVAAVEVATKTDVYSAKKGIILSDETNNFNYVLFMNNGSLCTAYAVDYIEVITMPTKTEYMEGEKFDITGMTVVATMSNDIVKDITNLIDFTRNVSKNGLIKINYTEHGITYTTTISVSVNAFDPSVVLKDFSYTKNNNGTYTITSWNNKLNGVSSTEMIVPDNSLIII